MWHLLLSTVAIKRHKKSDEPHQSNYISPMYKLYYQLYKLHKMDQLITVTTSLILGGARFVYSAIPNPILKTTLNGSKSHKTALDTLSSSHDIPSLRFLLLVYINKSGCLLYY